MPVLMVATYNEDNSVNVMNAAWGTMQARDIVALNLTETHKTVQNIKARGAFTVSIADVEHLVEADYFGAIYEKFKDENCPNPIISDKMKELSKQYTHKGFLKKKEFEEETLWTLYSLQDGVTSVSPEKYKNRGNGSLRFIESFYNLKGCNASKLSKMTLQSGKANIVFDGKYPVTESMVKGEKYRVLTFNSSGNIEDKPDNKYVKCSEFFFPGTFIHAYIYL